MGQHHLYNYINNFLIHNTSHLSFYMGIMIKSLVCVMLLAAPLLVHGGSIPKTQDESNPKLQKILNRNGRRLCKHTSVMGMSFLGGDCKWCKLKKAQVPITITNNKTMRCVQDVGIMGTNTMSKCNRTFKYGDTCPDHPDGPQEWKGNKIRWDKRRLCQHTE